MIVTLDGQKLETDFVAGTTLAGVIDTVRRDMCDKRLIVSVAVNGTTCDDAALATDQLGAPLDEADQIDLESDELEPVAADALRQIATEIAAIAEDSSAAADSIRAGDVTAGIREVGKFVNVWQTCQRALIEASQLLGRDLTQWQNAHGSVTASITKLAQSLETLRGALHARDMVLLADVISYELPDVCAEWSSVLGALADDVHVAPATDSRPEA